MRSGAGAYLDNYSVRCFLFSLATSYATDWSSRSCSNSPLYFQLLQFSDGIECLSHGWSPSRSGQKWRRVGGRSHHPSPPSSESHVKVILPLSDPTNYEEPTEDALPYNASLLAGGKSPKNQLLFPMRQERSQPFSFDLSHDSSLLFY